MIDVQSAARNTVDVDQVATAAPWRAFARR
jgi:hypothetical protein